MNPLFTQSELPEYVQVGRMPGLDTTPLLKYGTQDFPLTKLLHVRAVGDRRTHLSAAEPEGG